MSITVLEPFHAWIFFWVFVHFDLQVPAHVVFDGIRQFVIWGKKSTKFWHQFGRMRSCLEKTLSTSTPGFGVAARVFGEWASRTSFWWRWNCMRCMSYNCVLFEITWVTTKSVTMVIHGSWTPSSWWNQHCSVISGKCKDKVKKPFIGNLCFVMRLLYWKRVLLLILIGCPAQRNVYYARRRQQSFLFTFPISS